MKKPFLTFLLIIIYIFVFGQKKEIRLGNYNSVDNKFEKWSILLLQKENRFVYKYGQGGCQGEVTGSWIKKGNYLLLENGSEYINNENNKTDLLQVNDTLAMEIPLPFYPNPGKVKWKIKGNSLKTEDEIDTGCFYEKGIHKLKE